MQPKVSILIPTYNYNVLPLVEMIHRQAKNTAIEFEIIVLDDASTNQIINSGNSTISTFSNSELIILTENIGRTAVRQLLAEKSKYENLLFMDADVMPVHKDFIQRFNWRSTDWDLQFGGIEYEKTKPEKNKIFRWKYGIARESISISERKKDPYQTINSGCFLIKKAVFLEINPFIKINKYGMDNYFKQLLNTHQSRILHLDNPVFHLGLETTVQYLKKALQAVETTVYLEEKDLLKNDLRPLQKSFLKLKLLGLTGIFSFIVSKLKGRIERNFHSSNPSLFWFDIYRLNYYIELKRKKSA